jgi:hypothetical protein
MGFAVRLAVAFAVFRLDAAVAQEGYFGHDHKRSNAPTPKARAAILPIVVPPQGDRSMATTR